MASSDRPTHDRPAHSLSLRERALIRQEMCCHFGQDPVLAEGIFLRTWRSSARKGEPKLPPAVQSLLARGLMEIRPARMGQRAFFTAAGLRELRALLQDRRAMDPAQFAHLRRELGLEADQDDTTRAPA